MTAFLFDLDGTLCHTEPLHFRALQAVVRESGYDLSDAAFARLRVGETTTTGVRRLLPQIDEAECDDIVTRIEQRFRDTSDGLTPLPGVMAVLTQLAAVQAPTALVTNAPREDVGHTLGALGLLSRFDTVVIAGELARPKPDSLPYLEALRRLACDADDAIAFEDSVAGITSSTKAGIFTVGIGSSLSAEDLMQAGAHLTIRDYNDAKLSDLLAQRLSTSLDKASR